MADPRDEFMAAIRAALGPDAILPQRIEPGRWQRFSTNGKRSDSAGWFRMFPDLRAGVFGCYRASVSDVWSARSREIMTPAERAELQQQVRQAKAEQAAEQRQRWAINAERIGKVWAECLPLVQGDPVGQYLKRRGIVGMWPLPACLRLHRGLGYWHDGARLGEFPAMVAPIVAPDGQVVALHRTYLTRDGRKAEVPTVKKLSAAAGPLAGAAVPLYRPHAGRIGIAEGIETALAASCAAGVPTVAAYCADNLARWRWPADVRRLLVFADADEVGRKAADELVARAMRAGLQAQALAPSAPGADWADVWAASGVESAA
jgi:putative DNA primase/helicase